MGWAKFDDLYDDNPKVRRAFSLNAQAVSVHVLAITYSARHLTDGRVSEEWLRERVPHGRQRQAVLRVLVDAGLFDKNGTGYLVHDYLDYNPSRADVLARREREREAKRRAGKLGGQAKARNANRGSSSS